ncbi:hypothetical protein SEA_ATUIN_254 [Arthrobacter phage Atuin]|nr:hypothetical protein SEA_ATUIN_53 [Arthrobacter phage Atuin]
MEEDVDASSSLLYSIDMKKLTAALSLLSVLLLTACGWTGTGTLIEKGHSSAYETFYMQCTAFNAQGMCTVQIPQWYTVPESWSLKIRDTSNKDHWVSVNKPFWDSAKEGQQVTITED